MIPLALLARAGETGPGLLPLLFMIGFLVLIFASLWTVFAKAGKPGWACVVPIYNLLVLLDIAGKPAWWFLLFFLPIVNMIVLIVVCIGVAENFGKGAGFGIGLAFLGFIFYPILAFGDARYVGSRG